MMNGRVMAQQLPLIYEQADARRESGMQSSAAHANRVEPGWTEIAYAALLAYVARVDRPYHFTIDRARAALTVPPPPDLRAWGQVTQRAIKAGVIVPTGQFERAPSSNLSPKPLYRRA